MIKTLTVLIIAMWGVIVAGLSVLILGLIVSFAVGGQVHANAGWATVETAGVSGFVLGCGVGWFRNRDWFRQ